MRHIIALAGLSIMLAGSPAGAQELPGWPTGAACDAADNWCPRYEARTRVQVSGLWPTLPPDIRQTCVSETGKVEKSYRLLYDCLANAMREFTKLQQGKPVPDEVSQVAPDAAASPQSTPPEPRQAAPAAPEPTPPAATPPQTSPPAEPKPTPPTEAKEPPQTELSPPAANTPEPSTAAEPKPPTATEPAPQTPAPAAPAQ